jgi:hypothetical protein
VSNKKGKEMNELYEHKNWSLISLCVRAFNENGHSLLE